MADRKVVVVEEVFDKIEAAKFLHIGADQFSKQYKACADHQGGKPVTYKKSKLLDRYDELCESPREVPDAS